MKGELQYKFGHYLQEKGYTIRSLNLKNPEKSDRYNPFLYIEKEEDLIRLITNLHEAVKKLDAMQGEPFWDDGVDLYLQAIFYYEWLESMEESRVGSMNNILYLVNLETQKMPDGETTRLQLEMDKLAKRKGIFTRGTGLPKTERRGNGNCSEYHHHGKCNAKTLRNGRGKTHF